MENLFRNVSDKKLKIYCRQYREWQNSGIIPHNELGKMRDFYLSSYSYTWQVNLITDLLDVLMERWMSIDEKGNY